MNLVTQKNIPKEKHLKKIHYYFKERSYRYLLSFLNVFIKALAIHLLFSL